MRQLLIDTLSVQSYSYETKRMEAYILNFVERLGVHVLYDNGNIYVTKGKAETYPCIVSHTDSVHKIIEDDAYSIMADDYCAIGYNRKLMQPTGCGGDDKVGIAICLQALLDYDVIKVAFFKDEEVGCVGSYEAKLEFFDDCRFVLQCDRRGNSDFVNEIYGTPLQSKSFKKDVKGLLKRYGYAPTSGMLTDVYALKEQGLGISVANISCGYYNPHDDNEVVIFEDVDNCYALVCSIISNMTKVYNHAYEVKRSYGNYGQGYGRSYGNYGTNYRGYDYYDDYYTDKNGATIDEKDRYTCESCTNVVDVHDVEYNTEYHEWVCATCNKWLKDDINNYELKVI